ncbi:MAG: CHASE2 domain-containing protein [Rhodospirillaceae bacterium]|jgi:adenylate cyclase|nr:CHASE2 domain-containing protein [Rhodospirillaceae bacterium]MBT5456956.1 CHASE2 domain-containing protein [Rhodospirillaceae bacterium]
MSNISARLLLWVTPAVILALCLTLRAIDPPLLQDARHRVFDTYQRLKPRAYQELPVVVVDIDDRSLSELGQWPWPRSLLAKLVTTLTEYGAATIVFDAVFSEPDRTSPANLLRYLPENKKGKALRAAFTALPSHDDLFVDALSRNLVVTGFALTQDPPGPRPMHKAGIAVAGKDPKHLLPGFSGAVINLPAIEQAARGNAAMNLIPERDGIVRRIPLLLKLRETLYPSLAIEGLRVAQGATTFIVKASGASSEASFGEHTGFVEVKVGEFTTPTDAAGRVWLYETVRTKRRTVPAWNVLGGQPNLPRINGAIVLIGTSAAGLSDLRTTALYPYVPGVELQAQVIEQILT